MKDNKFLFAFAAVVVGSLSLAGLYVAVKGRGPAGAASGSSPDAATPARVEKFRDGEEIRFISGDDAGLKVASVPGGECNLDYLGQEGRAPAQTLVRGRATGIAGWASYPHASVQRMLLEWKPINTESSAGTFVELNSGLERSDVAESKHSDAYRNVGFGRSGSLLDIPSGTYRLYLVLDTKSGLIQCGLGRDVTVE